jgi:phytoene/squalene synthetase
MERTGATIVLSTSWRPTHDEGPWNVRDVEAARAHYRRADELMPKAWSDALKPARLMGEIYMKLLAKIEKHHYAVLDKKIQLNFFEKAATALVALRS